MKPAVEWMMQPEATEAGLALDAADEVVGNTDPFERAAQHELARVQHEHALRRDLDRLGERRHVVLDVDDPGRVVAEHPKQVADAHVDRRRLHRMIVERLDDDAAVGDLFAQGPIGKDHGPTLTPRSPSRCSPGLRMPRGRA